MTPMVDEAGNVWEVDEAGNPLRMIAPAASPAQQGRVFTLPQSPQQQAQAQRQAAADARQERNDSRDADNDAMRLRLQEAELALKSQQLAKGQTAGGNQGTKIDQAAAKRAQVEALTKQMLSVDKMLRDQFEGPNDRGLGEYLPTPTNRAFDAAAAGLSEQALGAFRVPGVGSQSDAELRAFNEANRLSASNYDEVNRQRFDTIRNRVDEVRNSLGMEAVAWGAEDQRADNEVPGQATGADDKPNPPGMLDGVPSNRGQLALPTNGERRIPNDKLNSKINALISAGAFTLANQELTKAGLPQITPEERKGIVAWQKANPGKKYNASDIADVTPLSMGQQILSNETIAPIAAGLASYANTAGAGIPAALAGEEGKGNLEAAAALNPNASAVGSVLGGVTGAMGAEAAIASRAPSALARYAPRLADMLYGGTLGFNSADEGEGLKGAAIGAGSGMLGGVLGDRAMRAVGQGVRGVVNPNVGYLQDRGISLTAGQVLGGGVKKIEDALTSVPFVGNMVDARRMEGLRDFNRAAFDTAATDAAGGTITDTGAAGLQQLRGLVSQRYDDALGGTRIDASDPAFIGDVTAANAAAGRIPNVNGAQDAATASLRNRIDGAIDPTTDEMTGRGFQEAYRGLARTGRERANGDYGHEIGQVMRQGQDALAGALERQNPGAFGAFRQANATNRNANVLAEAVSKAKNAEDEIFTPAQLNMADSTSSRRLTGPLASAAGERPFYDLATAGQAVLPSKLPDSGTWTRALVGGGLPVGVGAAGGAAVGGTEGAGTGAGLGLGSMLLLAAGGSRPAQRAIVGALTARPQAFRVAGDRLIANSRVGGWTGAGALAPLFVGN